jgi:phosphonate metabolism protein (transferase hexapeptide repeat family)
MSAFLAHDPSPRIHTTAELKGCRVGRYASIGERVILREVEVGDFSYFERHGEAIYTQVGKFCSIAANVRINALEHPMERLTTHKISYRPNEYVKYHSVDGAFRERRREKRVVIGNDVWIGHGAVVMPGVTLGHGCIVGANAVVTRDVEPFQIVAGAPARVLRDRFLPAVKERIIKMKWWDWPLELIARMLPDMQQMNIENFLDKWEFSVESFN